MAKPEGVRVLRVSRQILETLSFYVQSRSDWSVDFYITLTRVRMSKDLKSAKIGVRAVGVNLKDEDHQKAVEALKQRIIELQAYLAKQLKLRFTPKLQFVVDTGWDEILKVENTLRELSLEKKETQLNNEDKD